jgi:threonine/homoserine/homoserine lactone efflux protein
MSSVRAMIEDIAAVALPAIRWAPMGSLLLTSLVLMGSPGPTTMSLVVAGSAFGPRRCVPYLVGIVAGTTAVLLAVATGVTAALLALPAIASALRLLSAAYILWLAFHIATAPPLPERSGSSNPPSLYGGALLGVANPKAWIAIAAVLASTRLAAAPMLDAAAKVVLMTVMVVAIHVAWLAGGALIAPVLRRRTGARVVNAALAAALVGASAYAVLG